MPFSFEDTFLSCSRFEDNSYYLRPKYRIGDHVWTIVLDDEDNVTGIEEFVICEIRWDGDEFEYYDSEYFLYQEHNLFATKEEAEDKCCSNYEYDMDEKHFDVCEVEVIE